MGLARQESDFGLRLTDEETRELRDRPLEILLDEAFTRLAAETDGFNSEKVINDLRIRNANLLMGFFESRKKAYDSFNIDRPSYTGREIEMDEGVDKLTIVLADGPTGDILSIGFNSPSIRAELKIAKDFDGKYYFDVFVPKISATVGHGDYMYSVKFGPGSITSFERTRYLERPNGNTKDTRVLDFSDYHTTPR